MSAGAEAVDPATVHDERPRILRRIVIGLAIWNGITTCLIAAVALLCGKPVMRALLSMVAGVSILWINMGGALMYVCRDRIRTRVRTLRLDWRIVFVLFCTLLALLEEVVTTTMTNCAPFFGVPIGKAYITASTNYVDVVCLHSVVVFLPMFTAWAWMLNRWRFRPASVLLLFGITGTLAELSFGGPAALQMLGFWIFVYGLMVYLPAYCVPEDRPAKRPGPLQYLAAPVIPILCAIPLAIVVSRAHPFKMHFPPIVVDQPAESAPALPPYAGFRAPERVTIRGYKGDAMEPFITKDGDYLLFNNLNDPSVNTNVHYAARIDDLTFAYKGEITGVNTASLEGVPSMDRNGVLYFVSVRSYDKTFSTLYRGRFRDGNVTGVELVPGVSLRKPGMVNFDAEISDDGSTLYFVDGDLSKDPKPFSADIAIATRSGDGFRRDPNSADILRNVNTGALEYAPSISSDGLELFFTRVDRAAANPMPTIYRADRKSRTAPFDPPRRVGAIEGFVEGPTLSADGRSLYYHKRVGGRFTIYRVRR